jgi:hypothetical protein
MKKRTKKKEGIMFEFRDRTLNINIAGNEFIFEVDARIDRTIKRLSKEAVDIVKQYQDEKKTDDEVISAYKGYMSEILGDEAAADKIFANREPDVRDCMDILTYIANEIARFNQKSALTPIKGGK